MAGSKPFARKRLTVLLLSPRNLPLDTRLSCISWGYVGCENSSYCGRLLILLGRLCINFGFLPKTTAPVLENEEKGRERHNRAKTETSGNLPKARIHNSTIPPAALQPHEESEGDVSGLDKGNEKPGLRPIINANGVSKVFLNFHL